MSPWKTCPKDSSSPDNSSITALQQQGQLILGQLSPGTKDHDIPKDQLVSRQFIPKDQLVPRLSSPRTSWSPDNSSPRTSWSPDNSSPRTSWSPDNSSPRTSWSPNNSTTFLIHKLIPDNFIHGDELLGDYSSTTFSLHYCHRTLPRVQGITISFPYMYFTDALTTLNHLVALKNVDETTWGEVSDSRSL
jgi:hypothetical protein